MKLNEVRKLVAFSLTSLAVVIQAVVSAVQYGGWSALADPTLISIVATLAVGAYAVWASPNDPAKLDELSELVNAEQKRPEA